ncbi:hypothetical protein ACTFIW_000228 [Dictyostelium discoideum]
MVFPGEYYDLLEYIIKNGFYEDESDRNNKATLNPPPKNNNNNSYNNLQSSKFAILFSNIEEFTYLENLKLFMSLKRNDLFLEEWEFSTSVDKRNAVMLPSIKWCCLNLEFSSINNILKVIGESYNKEIYYHNNHHVFSHRLQMFRFCKASLQLGKTDITKSSFTILNQYFGTLDRFIEYEHLHKKFNENDYLIIEIR